MNMTDEIFDDPLRTPPTTDVETETWDDSGSIRGVTLEKPHEPGNWIYDVVLEELFRIRVQCNAENLEEAAMSSASVLGIRMQPPLTPAVRIADALARRRRTAR